MERRTHVKCALYARDFVDWLFGIGWMAFGCDVEFMRLCWVRRCYLSYSYTMRPALPLDKQYNLNLWHFRNRWVSKTIPIYSKILNEIYVSSSVMIVHHGRSSGNVFFWLARTMHPDSQMSVTMARYIRNKMNGFYVRCFSHEYHSVGAIVFLHLWIAESHDGENINSTIFREI